MFCRRIPQGFAEQAPREGFRTLPPTTCPKKRRTSHTSVGLWGREFTGDLCGVWPPCSPVHGPTLGMPTAVTDGNSPALMAEPQTPASSSDAFRSTACMPPGGQAGKGGGGCLPLPRPCPRVGRPGCEQGRWEKEILPGTTNENASARSDNGALEMAMRAL